MLLLVDAGNTRIKWALAESPAATGAHLGRWLASGALFHRDAGQLGAAWRELPIERAVISNVAGPAARAHIENALAQAMENRTIAVEWFASQAVAGGLRNGYRNPAQLGCDRFASAIGAHALFPQCALVVATCGTATTIDAVTADGIFIGGMILPGLGLMATSLARNTAQLPDVGSPVDIPRLFADNTDDAILSGCMSAQAGAIERAVAELARAHGKVQCILSGGAGPMIAPHLSFPSSNVDNLVMIGLQASMIEGRPC
jgi:type III pantothenate kinase